MPIKNPDYSSLNYDDMAEAIGLKVKHIPILLSSFLEESTPIITKIKEATASSDFTTIKASAHSLKGSAGNLKFDAIYEMAREIELASADNDTSFAYEEYIGAVKKAMDTIKL